MQLILRLSSLASGYSLLGKAEHVGTLGVLGSLPTLVGRQDAVRINLTLESLQELLTRWAGPGAAVDRATP
jgi:hypothetical protein